MERKRYILPVDIEELDEGGYLAICQLIPGCHAEGDTVGEAISNLEDVARMLFELMIEDGEPLPSGLDEVSGPGELHAQILLPIG